MKTITITLSAPQLTTLFYLGIDPDEVPFRQMPDGEIEVVHQEYTDEHWWIYIDRDGNATRETVNDVIGGWDIWKLDQDDTGVQWVEVER